MNTPTRNDNTIPVITTAPPRRRRGHAADTLSASAAVLATLQLTHELRFGWLYTFLWWLAICAGALVAEAVRRS